MAETVQDLSASFKSDPGGRQALPGDVGIPKGNYIDRRDEYTDESGCALAFKRLGAGTSRGVAKPTEM